MTKTVMNGICFNTKMLGGFKFVVDYIDAFKMSESFTNCQANIRFPRRANILCRWTWISLEG
jgi:hypothetical protein